MADPFGIAARFGLYLVLGLLFGLPAFTTLILGRDVRVLRLVLILPGLAAVAVVLSIVQLLLLAASMSGSDLANVDRATIAAILSAGSLGVAWKLRMAALAAILVGTLCLRRVPGLLSIVGMIGGGAALGSLAWVGHGTMGEDAAGWVHLVADILHLLSAALWLGALAGLTALVFRPARSVSAAHLALSTRALVGFARTGTAIVVALLITGAVNVWVLIGVSNIAALPMGLYGRLLLLKLALFVAMLCLAAANRFRLAPALARTSHGSAAAATRHLRISLAIETLCILAILLLVAWLGTLPPTGDV